MKNRMSSPFGPGPMVTRGALVPVPQKPGYGVIGRQPPKQQVGTTKKMCLCAQMKNAGRGRAPGR